MTTELPEQGTGPSLFGRGMIYVLVWSMQLLAATVVSPIVAHALSMEEFGRVAAALALYQLLVLISVFGIDQALEIRRVEDAGDDRPARGLLTTGVVFAFALAGILALTARWWAPVLGFDRDLTLVLVALAWVAPGSSVLLVLGILQAEDRLRRFATVSFVSTVGSQLCGLLLIFLVRRDATTYVAGGVIGQSLALLGGLLWVGPRLQGAFDPHVTRQALRLGLPLVLTSLAEYILTTADRLVVQRWFGSAQVAQYQVGFVVGNAVTLMLIFTNRAWLPRLKAITDPEVRWQLIASSRDGVYWLLGWALLGVTVAAPGLLRVWVPDTYDRPALTRIIFVVGLCAIPVAAMGASQRMLVTMRWSRPLAASAVVAVVAKLIALAVLLATVGLLGAAISTLVALAVQAIYLRRAVVRRHPAIPSQPSCLVFLGVSAVLAAASLTLPVTTTWDVVRVAFAMLCLVPFAAALRRLQRAEPPVSVTAARTATDRPV
ncbi:lipopolysaccharide biosynthesis protein [Flexivirga sp. ID2601S]|uniref:Lipopolysaccharide biosynthesis protein n=1 Tax=Flexivirga aerilata TaxID=1656889 RepID=A0A849AH83_9MICO|nr:lipopolysaccharide biosynthesis protein [Flexivirga aerilata]NNG38558.1 lipopolysaccharide biosynthesis protein [Flexivirga aerilata]